MREDFTVRVIDREFSVLMDNNTILSSGAAGEREKSERWI